VLIPYGTPTFLRIAKIYNWQPQNKKAFHPQADIDRWILSLSQKLAHDVRTAMDNYNLGKAVEPFVSFIDQLTNWYIRRSRPRFWSEVASQDRDEAFETLYRVLMTLAKVAAPFIPFVAEAIYLNLRSDKEPLSVHLCDFLLEKTCDKSLKRDGLANGC
jgi:isoleucyl-tRNA synthetase